VSKGGSGVGLHFRLGRFPFVLHPARRIAPFAERDMDTWESFFREKSSRRSRSKQRLIKIAIVALLAADAMVISLMFAGWRPWSIQAGRWYWLRQVWLSCLRSSFP